MIPLIERLIPHSSQEEKQQTTEEMWQMFDGLYDLFVALEEKGWFELENDSEKFETSHQPSSLLTAQELAKSLVTPRRNVLLSLSRRENLLF